MENTLQEKRLRLQTILSVVELILWIKFCGRA